MRLKSIHLLATVVALLPGVTAQAQTPSTLSKGDIALLNKAVDALQQGKARTTTSKVQMLLTSQGMSVTFHEQVHLVSQQPGKYHSDVTLVQQNGTPGAKYTIISNGAKVWVYQPGARSYCVLTRSAFQDDDISALGLLGSLVTDTTGAANGRLDLTGLTHSGLKIEASTDGSLLNTATGKTDYRIFAITDPKQGFTLQLIVDPQTAQVHQLTMSGKQPQTTFNFSETISQQSPTAAQPASLFYFTPPPGVKRIKKISIGPF